MSRYAVTLARPRDVMDAVRVIHAAPQGSRVEVKGPQRNLDQNARLWAMLSDVALAKPMGRTHTPDQWKVIFLHAWGREVQFLPALDGSGFVPWGQSSSDLSRVEMSELLEFIAAWAAQNEIELREPDKVAA